MVTGDVVTAGMALFAGVASLLSPCVLALVPAYMSYISGVSTAQQHTATLNVRLRVMLHAFLFVLGFSVVFVAFGLSASLLGQFLLRNQAVFRQLSGVVVIAFGLHTAGWLRIPFLDRQTQIGVVTAGSSPLRALLIGMAFAAGWSPCVGPILGSILLLASQSDTAGSGSALLAAYSAGMAIPFLLMAFFLTRMDKVLRFVKKYSQQVSMVTGIFLIVIGVMLYTNSFGRIAALIDDTGILQWLPF